jgi:hypothetical protein
MAVEIAREVNEGRSFSNLARASDQPGAGMIGVPGWKNTKYPTAMMHAMEKVVATSINMPWRAF